MAAKISDKISENELLNLAKKIGPSYYPSLGNKLGFGQAELDNFLIRSQQDVQKAIQTILKRWNANRPMSENSRKVLGDILDETELKAIADLLRSGKVTDQGRKEPNLTGIMDADSCLEEILEVTISRTHGVIPHADIVTTIQQRIVHKPCTKTSIIPFGQEEQIESTQKKTFEETTRENQEQTEELRREVSQKSQNCASFERERVNRKRRKGVSEIKYKNKFKCGRGRIRSCEW